MYSKILISGRLVEPADDKPRSGVTLTLSSVKNSSVVLKHATYRCVTGGNGEYSFKAAPGTYAVAVSVYGAEPERVGQISVYADSSPGDLNSFLMNPGVDDLTPEIIRLVDSMRREAVKAAESAKNSEQIVTQSASDVAEHAQQVASDKVVVAQKATIATDAAATAVSAKEQASKDALATGKDRQVTQTKAQEAAASAGEAKEARDSIVHDAADVRLKATQVAENAATVANNTAAVQRNTDQVAQNTQVVSTKAQQVSENTQSVAANTLSVTQMRDEVAAKTCMAQAAADTATQKAASAAEHDASSSANAKIAQDAAAAVQGVLIDGGECDLSSGVYPPPQTVAGKNYSTVWYVKTGGTVSGVAYDTGDVLRYTTAKGGYYFRVDAVDTTTAQISQHAAKAGAHTISGVLGLTEALADKADAAAVAEGFRQHSLASDPHAQYVKKADANPFPQYSDFRAGESRMFDTRVQLAKRSAEYHPMDGQVIPRATDQGLLAAIMAGDVPSCSDADWLADPYKRGNYTLGDGLTTIRLPDLNGKHPDAVGAVFARGDGKNSAPVGMIQADAIRNFIAKFDAVSAGGAVLKTGYFSGAAKRAGTGKVNTPGSVIEVDGDSGVIIDPSLVVPTGPENRVLNTTKVWATKR